MKNTKNTIYYVIDTNNDIENIVVVETDVILMVECEICHKKEE
jgi:hypothetical protein